MITIAYAKKQMLLEILEIMNYYIVHTNAVLRTKERTAEEILQWYEEHEDSYPILVAREEEHIVGYASLSRFRPTDGYNQTAELSIYVEPGQMQKGIGAQLMQRILAEAKEGGFHLVVSVITAANEGSLLFHQKYGFEMNGRLPEAGFKNGAYQDVILMSRKIN